MWRLVIAILMVRRNRNDALWKSIHLNPLRTMPDEEPPKDTRVIIQNRTLFVEVENPLPVTAPSPLPVSGSVAVTSLPRYEYRVLVGGEFFRVPTIPFLARGPGAVNTGEMIRQSLLIWFNEGFEIDYVDPVDQGPNAAGGVTGGLGTAVVVLRRQIS